MKTIDPDSYFAKMQRGEVLPPPVHRTLGGRIAGVDVEAGTLEAHYVGSEAGLNPAGHVQGGMLAAMLDDVTAFLVTATLAAGESCSTLNLNVSFLRPALPGAIVGRSRLVRRGREVCHVAGELLQEGKLVATATATCMAVRGR
jgi:uncharacterized protein (TIGR00369 family)